MSRSLKASEEIYTVFDGMPLFYSDPVMDVSEQGIVIWLELIVRDKATKVCLRKELVQMTLNEFGNKRLFNSRLNTILGRTLPLGGGDPARWARYHRSFVWEAAEAALLRGVRLPREDQRLGLWNSQPMGACVNALAA
ncbi:hypothetical protein NKI09_07110 [Mesorhizobium sp. M0757]|uniref:hypothetical protein n=1 Tax=Mesorhizobium sp. M0757 TaxID=2956993 RepID=UPI00333BE7BA